MAKGISEMLVKIGLDTSEFEKKAQAFRKNFRQLGNQMQQVGAQMATAFGGVAAGLGGALAYTVTKALDFEQAIKNASIAAGDSGKSFKNLQALALEMGSKTSFSAKEAADGITELLKAGMSVENVMAGGLKAALDLAVIGGMELAEAASFTSDAMNAFKKDGLSAAETANILAGAANKSSADLADIQYSLAAVGAVANTVGMSLNDTASAVAIFANAGLKGSDAGTSLKTMLLNLNPSSKEQIKLAKQLGLITADGSNQFFDQEGKLKDLKSITSTITKTFKKYTAQQRISMMQTLFGTDAIRAASILYDAGAESVSKMNMELGTVDAAQSAAEKQDTVTGAIERLKGSLETAAISLGTTFLPGLKSLTEFLDGVINKFNAAPEPIKQMISWGLAITAGLAALTAVVGVLVFSLGALAAAEWAVILPIAGIIAAVVAVIAIFIGLTVAIRKLWNENEGFRNAVTTIWTAISTAIMTVVNALVIFFTNAWNNMKQGTISAFNSIKLFFQGFFAGLRIIFTAFSSAFDGDWKAAWEGLKTAFNVFKEAFLILFRGLFSLVDSLFKTFGVDIRSVFNSIVDFISGLGSKMYEAGSNIITSIIDGIKSKFGAIKDTMTDVAGKIRSYLPFSPAEEGPLKDLNHLDFAGPITDSIIRGVPTVQTALDSMLTVNQAQSGFGSASQASAGNTTVVLQLDGKVLSKSVFQNLGGVFRVAGAVT